ncbi:O-antigen ligase family protein [Neobacillus sp. YIM B06451]|uniref:O-antigen ligase family protein n=1 Tax=Neobacillus sp. YIM B06451 TaxID=3070994 RepID=UPI00292FF174|nr:O-antigen ligase family protein [Neobacillus sp. YIM B06451]
MFKYVYSVILCIFLFFLVFFSANDFALLQQNETSIYSQNYAGLKIVDWFSIILIALGVINIFYNKFIFVSKIQKSLFLFLIAVLYGILIAIYNKNSLDLNQIGLQTWKYIIYAFFIGLTLINFKFTEKHLLFFVEYFLLLAFIKSSTGLINYFSGNGHNFYFLGKIVFSTVDTLYIICVAYFYVLNRIIFKNNKKYYFIYIIVFLLVILFSLKRNFLLIITVGSLLTLIFSTLKGKAKIILLSLLVCLCMLPSVFYGGIDIDTIFMRIKGINIFNEENNLNKLTSDNGHLDDIYDGIDNVKKSPIFGQGFNTFIERYRVTWQESSTFLHNAYLTVWINMGILGLVLYINIIFTIFRDGFTNFYNTSSENKIIKLFLMQISVSIFIDGIAFAPIYTFPTIFNIIIILISIVILLKIKKDSKLGEYYGK